jgi:hypothetical protein
MKFRALLLLAFAFAAACGPSATDVCSQFAQVWCQQQYTCKQGTDLQAIQTKYGADVPTCVKVYEQQNGCTNTNQLLCPLGTSYDTGRGQQCTTDYQALSCSDIQANVNPSDCDLASYICH